MRIAMFDIEASNLNANFGQVLCACFKELNSDKIKTFRKSRGSDASVVSRIVQEINKYDFIVTWNGINFDVSFIRTRQLLNRCHDFIDPRIRHLDLWYLTKKFLRFTNNRLDTVSTDLGFAEKTRISGDIWVRAMEGNKKALEYIIYHCKKDVLVLEKVYYDYQKQRLLRQLNWIPRI